MNKKDELWTKLAAVVIAALQKHGPMEYKTIQRHVGTEVNLKLILRRLLKAKKLVRGKDKRYSVA